jgi:hypothetical protein
MLMVERTTKSLYFSNIWPPQWAASTFVACVDRYFQVAQDKRTRQDRGCMALLSCNYNVQILPCNVCMHALKKPAHAARDRWSEKSKTCGKVGGGPCRNPSNLRHQVGRGGWGTRSNDSENQAVVLLNAAGDEASQRAPHPAKPPPWRKKQYDVARER